MKKKRDLSSRDTRHDIFYRRAKESNFAARSVFKLEEIDQRFQLLRSGYRVLDLGCRPGSWLQYAAKKVGSHGFLVGVDRKPLDSHIVISAPHRIVVGDIYELEASDLLGELPHFDVVLSDMAPDTSGVSFADQVRSIEIFQRALTIAVTTLRQGGSFVGKIFMGDGFQEVVQEVKRHFHHSKTIKPDASRKISTELYLVATDKK